MAALLNAAQRDDDDSQQRGANECEDDPTPVTIHETADPEAEQTIRRASRNRLICAKRNAIDV